MFSLFDHSFLIVNPYDQPVLPRSLQNIDSMISISDDASNTEYHRLQGPLLHEQTIPLNSLVSTIVPTRRCFMPILSFVTDSNSLDLPIPLLCDWIVVSSGTIPGCEDLCEAIREPLLHSTNILCKLLFVIESIVSFSAGIYQVREETKMNNRA